MNRIGFDNEKYLKLQSQNIRDRIGKFGGKLYLEFGGKLFDDYHASRVLPGFEPDSKVRMLLEMKDEAEIVIAISADDIERSKRRGDLGITYEDDTLRLIDAFRGIGLYIGSVVITHYRGQAIADAFRKRLEALGVRTYLHYIIPEYPANVPLIVSDDGFGKNDYIETERSLIVVTAPGPGSGKMATCLSQLYHEHKRGIDAGYAKFETFPVWNLPLKHPVNLAYEAATADLDDVNMIDPYHLEAYGETTVNYNRDVEIFPVLEAMFRRIYGESPYKSPTDMGVNVIAQCICDDEACREASKQEIIRRWYKTACAVKQGRAMPEEIHKLELLMRTLNLDVDRRGTVLPALRIANETGEPAVAIELNDGYFRDAVGYLEAAEDELEQICPRLVEMFGEQEHPEQEWSVQHVLGSGDDARYYVLEKHILPDETGREAGQFLAVRDNTEDQSALRKERYTATHDALTGLYNRSAYNQLRWKCQDENIALLLGTEKPHGGQGKTQE